MNQKMSRGQQKKSGSLQVLLAASLFIFFSGVGLCRANDWEPLPWGLNLEQLNQAYQKKVPNGQIKADKERTEIEIQYSPLKIIKAKGGELTALISSRDSSSSYRLFGYSYEGKFFGQAIYFKDHPEFFPETINSTLKKKYPEGRNIRTFTGTQMTSFFEFKSENLYVFSSEKGVFFYDPYTLEMVVKKFQDIVDQEKERFLKKWRDKPLEP
jgi:hypothetical protein